MPRLTVEITGDSTGLKSALGEAEGATKGFGASIGGSALAVAGLAAGAGVAVAAIAGLTQAAAEDRDEQNKLLAVYEGAGAAVGDYTAQIDAAIEAGAEKAFSDSEVRAGLESLIVATGDAAQANAMLGPAMDIARFAGVSLEDATKALAKAHNGQDAALRKLIPGLEKGKTATDTIAAATEIAAGQADVYAASSEGMGKKGSDAFAEIGETLGSAFLPVMDAVVPALIPVLELLGELIKEMLPLLKPVIMVIVGALKIFIDVLMTVLRIVKDVVDWIGNLADTIRNAIPDLSGIGDLIGSIDLNPFAAGGVGGAPVPSARGVSTRAAGGAGTSLTINVYGGDPARLERAVRDGWRRWTGNEGASAPTREW